MDVVEPTPGAGPARDFVDGAVPVKTMEAGIRVGLQRALEILQMPPRMFTLAVF